MAGISNPSFSTKVLGIVAGSCTMWGALNLQTVPSKVIEKLHDKTGKLTDEEKTRVWQAVDKMNKDSGLEAKGLKYLICRSKEDLKSDEFKKFKEKYFDEPEEKLKKEMQAEDTSFFKKCWLGLKRIYLKTERELSKETVKQTVNGKNACFEEETNTIIINPDKRSGSVFHEAGHAMNNDKKPWYTKLARIFNTLTVLAATGLIAKVGLMKTKKAPGEEIKGFIDGATDFVKNHAGKIAFALWIPRLIEEFTATTNGYKYAKENLPEKTSKKILIDNLISFMSYVAGALTTAGAVTLGIFAKDAIARRFIK